MIIYKRLFDRDPQSESSIDGAALELANEQVAKHLSRRDPNRDAEGGQVECRAEHIGEAKWQHGRNPALSEFERPAAVFGHHVLLDASAMKVVHRSSRVVLRFERSGRESVLVAGEDVEVVVGLSNSMKWIRDHSQS